MQTSHMMERLEHFVQQKKKHKVECIVDVEKWPCGSSKRQKDARNEGTRKATHLSVVATVGLGEDGLAADDR